MQSMLKMFRLEHPCTATIHGCLSMAQVAVTLFRFQSGNESWGGQDLSEYTGISGQYPHSLMVDINRCTQGVVLELTLQMKLTSSDSLPSHFEVLFHESRIPISTIQYNEPGCCDRYTSKLKDSIGVVCVAARNLNCEARMKSLHRRQGPKLF